MLIVLSFNAAIIFPGSNYNFFTFSLIFQIQCSSKLNMRLAFIYFFQVYYKYMSFEIAMVQTYANRFLSAGICKIIPKVLALGIVCIACITLIRHFIK